MTKVLSQGRTKEAALYFDGVLADDFVSFVDSTLDEKAFLKKSIIPFHQDVREAEKVFLALAGLEDGAPDFGYYFALHAAAAASAMRIVLKKSEKDILLPEIYENVSGLISKAEVLAKDAGIKYDASFTLEEHKNFVARVRREKNVFLNKLGFDRADLWTYQEAVDKPKLEHESQNYAQSVEVTLRGLQLVDPSELSWEQILEFRKDHDAVNDLRKIRLFYQENFEGKDEQYVEDRLHTLQFEHEKATKLWGFETAQKAFSVVFDNRSMVPASVGGVIAATAGLPLSMAALTAATVPVGRFALEISRAALDAFKAREDNPVAYLTRLKKLGED